MSNFYGATSLIGGTSGALDKIDGANLASGDGALVITSTGGYIHYLDAASGATESSPNIISPDSNAGNKRWILVAIVSKETVTELLKLYDTDKTHTLSVKWNENDTGDRVLNLLVSGANRTLTITGDSTINQSVATGASPTFVGATLSGLTASKLVATDASKNLVSIEPTVFESGGAQEIDGDNLDIDYSPDNYVTASANLGDHLAGIDNVLGASLMSAYGVRWDTSLPAPAMTKGIVSAGVFIPFEYTSYPIQEQMKRCVLNAAQELQYYLDPDDSTKKLDGTDANIDGTDGQVMVQTAQFHHVDTIDGDYRYILNGFQPFYFIKSDTTRVQSAVHPWFWEGGVLSSHKYFSAFEGVLYDDSVGSYVDGTGSILYASGDKIHSVSGYIPMTYINRTEMRAACAVDTGYHQQAYWGDHAMILLFITEYATWYSQDATGIPGYTAGTPWDLDKRCKTGITAALGNQSGSISYADAAVGLRCTYDWSGSPTIIIANSFRGIENFYGHLWKWVDGINIQFIDDGGSPAALTDADVYICNNPADFADDTDTDYEDLAIDLPLTSGYQSALHAGTFLPSSISGGESNKYITGYYYASATAGWRALWSGGFLCAGAVAGVACRYASLAASYRNAHLGGRSAA